MKPRFFATPEKFRAWLEKNHAKARELLVGYFKKKTGKKKSGKKGSGKASIDWPQSVDEALCFGWIDGVRRSLGAESYVIRFTPRKPRSTWSAINIRRVKALKKLGRMAPAGLAGFAKRTGERSAIYAYEQRHQAKLAPQERALFRRNAAAWQFFESAAPWYRQKVLYWVTSARKPETRRARLAKLIATSAAERRL